MSRTVFLSDRGYVPEDEARVSLYDSWTMYGDCVFEMLRSFNGMLFKLDAHLDRLAAGMKELKIPDPYTRRQWQVLCRDIMGKNDHGLHAEHRVMINVSRGPLEIYADVDGLSQGPTVTISDVPCAWATQGLGQTFVDGLNLSIPRQHHIPSSLLDANIKTRNRLHFILANMGLEPSADRAPRTWALLSTPDGLLTEGTGANLFIVKRNVVLTPAQNVLHGISRQYVMSMIPVVEADDLRAEDLANADEAFMTATPFCMLPVTQFFGKPIGDGVPGPVYQRLLLHWSKAVGVDIAAQIQQWDEGRAPFTGSSPYQAKS